jgi:hypothetical protein
MREWSTAECRCVGESLQSQNGYKWITDRFALSTGVLRTMSPEDGSEFLPLL